MLVRGKYAILDPSLEEEDIKEDWAVRIDGDKIVETGPYRTLKQKYPDQGSYDGKQLLMPGLLTLIPRGRSFLCAAGRYL